MSRTTTLFVALLAAAAPACTGTISDDTGDDDSTSPVDDFGVTGLRRLTRFEVAASVDVAFDASADAFVDLLPEDQSGTNPFDNTYASQTVSPLVIAAYGQFAEAYAQSLAADANITQRLAGCTPATADDRACFDAFAKVVGRRMFRRPLTTDELDRFAGAILPYAKMDGSFATAVELLGELLVQHPAFLYRVEKDGAKLDAHEVATRVAFLAWGAGPDDELLDAADSDALDSAHRAEQAKRLMATPRAQRNWEHFHALWLGYDSAALPAAVHDDLLSETNHLIDRVVFEQNADWMQLFAATQTYITPALAQLYALPAVTSPQWVTYPAGRGGGVLAQGTVLSIGAKFGDTSPTVRGAQLYARLSCGDLGTIPPGIDTDLPPGLATDCKPQRYTMSTTPGCDGCHGTIDNIGFGLENVGVGGAWRTTEPGKPQCTITGTGTWNNTPFMGPAELGALVAQDPAVSACATKQLFRYMTGRDETANDAAALSALASMRESTPGLADLVVQLAASSAITKHEEE
ncbi:MAG TPA: DUF1592 domain-containing protein [Kofleriaceae bacterium]|jgi:hypothetical protein